MDPELLRRTADIAAEYLDSLPQRPVRADASLDELRAALRVGLEDGPRPALEAGDRPRLGRGRGPPPGDERGWPMTSPFGADPWVFSHLIRGGPPLNGELQSVSRARRDLAAFLDGLHMIDSAFSAYGHARGALLVVEPYGVPTVEQLAARHLARVGRPLMLPELTAALIGEGYPVTSEELGQATSHHPAFWGSSRSWIGIGKRARAHRLTSDPQLLRVREQPLASTFGRQKSRHTGLNGQESRANQP